MEQLDLGALGFAGICRETYRVLLRRAILPNKGGRGAVILSALLLPNAANCAFLSLLQGADDLLPVAVGFLQLSLACTAAFVFPFRVTSLYCTDGDSGAFDLFLRNLPRAPLPRLVRMLLHVTPLAISYTILCIAAWLVLLLLDPSNEVATLPLRVIGGGTCLAGAAYASVVLHIACVVAVLERDNTISDLRRSRALLAGKFWAAAAVFVPLDGCFVALQVCLLLLLKTEGALGLGHGFRAAVGAARAVALWVVVVVTLAAQPVVYLVCKNHHHDTRSSTAA